MDKENVCIGIQWNIIQPLKRGDILPFATIWMDLKGIMLSEISQTEISLIRGLWKKINRYN